MLAEPAEPDEPEAAPVADGEVPVEVTVAVAVAEVTVVNVVPVEDAVTVVGLMDALEKAAEGEKQY